MNKEAVSWERDAVILLGGEQLVATSQLWFQRLWQKTISTIMHHTILSVRSDIISKLPVSWLDILTFEYSLNRADSSIEGQKKQQLVTWAPYGDKRPSAKQTRLCIIAPVIVCLLLTALAVLTLIPRSVDKQYAGVKAVFVTYDESSRSVYMNITNTLNITNNNLYPIEVGNITGQVQFRKTVIGKLELNRVTKIRSLRTKQVYYNVSTKIGAEFGWMYAYCMSPVQRVHSLAVNMQVTATISGLWHSQQLSEDVYQIVDCGENITYDLDLTNLFDPEPNFCRWVI